MNSIPLVSVILIFLNEERFLEESIESVLAQTFEDWELLLVDDGSTDASSAIAQGYAERFPGRIRYLDHDGHANRGMSLSRNLGIRAARGQYIAHLDGDDVWLPEKLEEQVAILQHHPEAAMVYGPLKIWYSWTGRPEHQHKDCYLGVNRSGHPPNANRLVQPPEQLLIFLRDTWYIPGAILIKKQVLLEVGAGEEDFPDMYEDAIVLVKICLKYPVFVADKCWYLYRRHADNCTLSVAREGRAVEARQRYLDRIRHHLTRQNVIDRRVWRALERGEWMTRHHYVAELHALSQGRFVAERLNAYSYGIGRRLLPRRVCNWVARRFTTDHPQHKPSLAPSEMSD